MDKKRKLEILDLMITARCLQERMAKMSKTDEGFFWLGGIGEEAFNVPLGLLTRPGEGLKYDYFHFHYRNDSTMLAFGMEPIEELRQMKNRETDKFSGGRNFCNHYAYKPWNVAPVASTIQTQCSIAHGTAIAQKRAGGDAISVVTFGDAGTAEGDFHVGLNWATLPGKNFGFKSDGLPVLFICTNNNYGISTHYEEVHGQRNILKIAAGYGMETALVDGNDVEASCKALEKAIGYVRKERKPFFLEAMVSRLHGHSSSSGANRVPDEKEVDPLHKWRDRLIEQKVITQEEYDEKYKEQTQEMMDLLKKVRKEPEPTGDSIYRHIYAEA